MDPVADPNVVTTTTVMPQPDLRAMEREEALARRFRRKQQADLKFEFTRDPGLLHQYYKLRENEYNIVYGIDKASGSECEHDHNGQVMVVRMGNMCVGGVRLNIKTPRKPDLLPLETNDFRIEKHFPYLRHKQISYGQTSALVLLPEFRGSDVALEIFRRLSNRAVALNLGMLFCVAPMANARMYRHGCISIGLTETRINFDIEMPVYEYLEDIKLYLVSIVIDKSFSKDPMYLKLDTKPKELTKI